MEKHLVWWDLLPYYRKKQLAEKEHWTTPEKLTDHQIKMIYKATQGY